MQFLKDCTGQYSSMRIALMIIILITIYLLWLFTRAFIFELQQEHINYTGLATLFTAFFVSFTLAIFAKVWQTKHELYSRNDQHKHK